MYKIYVCLEHLQIYSLLLSSPLHILSTKCFCTPSQQKSAIVYSFSIIQCTKHKRRSHSSQYKTIYPHDVDDKTDRMNTQQNFDDKLVLCYVFRLWVRSSLDCVSVERGGVLMSLIVSTCLYYPSSPLSLVPSDKL